jgi:hypothetical protein
MLSTHNKQRGTSRLQIIAFVATVALILLISCDTIGGTSSHHSHNYLRVQLGICMILLIDISIMYALKHHANRITGLFKAYIFLLIAVVYFSSLIFYSEERAINPDVHTYGDAIWWAIMCMTTAGSYIGEYTLCGKIMAVILSGGGLILFPVFTVYITSAVTHKQANI